MCWCYVERGRYRTRYSVARCKSPRRRRLGLSGYAGSVQGCAGRFPANTIAIRSRHRCERRATRYPASPDRTILRCLPNIESSSQDRGFASGHIAVKSAVMPLYMDIHELGEVTADDVANAHVADVEAQEKYGVQYLKYWVNERCGKVFCLVNAPNPEAANCCHREAHG